MEFYKSIFGGELTIQTYKEAGFSHDPKEDDYVIHSMLKNELFTIMASDGNKDHPVRMGDNINMSLVGSDEVKLKEYFQKLSEGGTVKMALEKQFWGDVYGQLVDKFGVHWSINIGELK
jgi:PhnB protein